MCPIGRAFNLVSESTREDGKRGREVGHTYGDSSQKERERGLILEDIREM